MKSKVSEREQQLFDSYIKKNTFDGKLIYIGQILRQSAHAYPERTALLCEQESITYKELYKRVQNFAQELINQGVKPRDRVFVYVYNSIEFYVAYYAVLQVGAVVVPLNIFLKERELSHILHDAKPALIIASQDLAERVKACSNGITIPPIITDDALRQLASKAETTIEPITLDRDEMAVLLYTSGTTGLPKGVMLSSNNVVINVMQGAARFEPLPTDRLLAPLPLFHSFAQNGFVWTPILLGIAVIVVPRIERRYILSALERHKPTIIAGVPAFFGLLCLFKTAPLDSVRYFLSGSDALPDKIRSAFSLLYRRKIVCGYGMTETSPFVSGDFEDEAMVNTTVGKPIVDISYEIRDEQGKELPQGTIGQLWLKGPNIMLGYYNEPTMTQQVLRDGWLSTGDLAYIDEKGRFVITGRYKDLIKHKGFNIYPQEIENVLSLHQNVLRAAVIGQDDEMYGQVAIAYVQLKEAQDGMEQILRDLCVKNLADYKVPKTFIVGTQELPMTATGKIDKKALAAKKS